MKSYKVTLNIQKRHMYRDRTNIGHGRGPAGGGNGDTVLSGKGLYSGIMKCFGTRGGCWLHNIMNVLKATELFT